MIVEKSNVFKILEDHKTELYEKFNIESLSVFGSESTGLALKASDVDILVRFRKTPGIFAFINLKSYLEQIIGKTVDLVTEGALKKQLRDRIMQEAKRVAQELAVSSGRYLDALVLIAEYTEGLSYDQWKEDQKTIDAVIRNFEIIGEAAAHIP